MAETKIRSQDILDATVTDVDIAAANKDGLTSLASLRTLGTGAAQAAPGNDSRFLPTDTVVVAGTRILANKLVGTDTQPAFRLFGDGKLEWGPGGTTAPDTNLYRPAGSAGHLKTDGWLHTGQYFILGENGGGQIYIKQDAGRIFFGVGDDTVLYRVAVDTLQTDDWFRSSRISATLKAFGAYYGSPAFVHFQILADGKIQWGPGNTDVDTVLYRTAPGWVKTDGVLASAQDIYSHHGNATQQIVLAGSTIGFGTPVDANIYRYAGQVLAMDGALRVHGDAAQGPGIGNVLHNFTSVGQRWLKCGPPDSAGAGFRTIYIDN